MNRFCGWIGALMTYVTIAYLIVGNCMRFLMWMKCLNVNECYNKQCLNRAICYKYHEALTEEECQQLLKMIEDLKKQSS